MVIVRLMDGLGNQMFQYALIKAMENLGKDAYADISWFEKHQAHNGLELEKIFPIELNIADKRDVGRLGYIEGDKRYIFHRILRKLYPKKTFIVRDRSPISAIKYDGKILNLDDVYLLGYWQSEKYFEKSTGDIKKLYRSIIKQNFSKYDDGVCSTESVSIHIRRGDYLNTPVLGGICDLAYYKKAVEYISAHVPNPRYFIFSNDIEWCKANLKLDGAVYVQGNTGAKSYLDMRLMMMCKHNIIANSSFSWWGAWLNNNPDKIVVAPNRWFNGYEGTGDLIPDDWIKVSVC